MTAHGEALRAESQDDELVKGVKQDYTRLDLSASERAMLDYAVKLTMAPSTASQQDIETLRSHGFDDRDILDVIYVICLYNFNDRMADATGISGHDFLYG
jgi:4-carboxymuconolactone decarboxylase